MREKSPSRAANLQRSDEDVWSALNWDDLRVFSKCVEKRSFRAAAKVLRLDSGTIVRRIDRLEHTLRQQLFARSADGVTLTEEGKRIQAEVLTMERASMNVARLTQLDARALNGVVRLAVTEGLGTYWILPRLLDFQKAHRRLTIELQGSMNGFDVGKLETDIAIQFCPPERSDLITARLGYMHVYPFASPEYAEQFGLPQSCAEIVHHRIIQQVAPLLDETAYARELGLSSVEGIVGVRTNASSSVLHAVERGAGIGFLPTYVLSIGAKLVPVDIGLRYRIGVWITYHPDLKNSHRHMVIVDWLRRIFDPKRFPCFGETFIHPIDLARAESGVQDDTSITVNLRPFAGGSGDNGATDHNVTPKGTRPATSALSR